VSPGCLSGDALARLQAELASPAERRHVAGCAACTGRARRLAREVDLIAGVLRDTREPRGRVAARRRWLPAMVSLAVAGLALLVWIEVMVWRAVTPVPPTVEPQEVTAILSDVSTSLFSVNGDPSRAQPGEPPQSLEALAREVDSTLTGGEP
jgi:hypothetical protein